MLTDVFCVQRLTVPSSCPEKYSQLMNACWNVEPKERPNFYSILALLDHFCKGDYFNIHIFCCYLILFAEFSSTELLDVNVKEF